MYLATKILLGIAFAILIWAVMNFVMTLAQRRKEAKEVREMQKLKEEEEQAQLVEWEITP